MDSGLVRPRPDIGLYVVRFVELADPRRVEYRRMARVDGVDHVDTTTDESQNAEQNSKHDAGRHAVGHDVPVGSFGFGAGHLLDVEQYPVHRTAVCFEI